MSYINLTKTTIMETKTEFLGMYNEDEFSQLQGKVDFYKEKLQQVESRLTEMILKERELRNDDIANELSNLRDFLNY